MWYTAVVERGAYIWQVTLKLQYFGQKVSTLYETGYPGCMIFRDEYIISDLTQNFDLWIFTFISICSCVIPKLKGKKRRVS